jgi:glycogen operon protein
MLLMGDEARRTQLGNNNAYCQDNELSWFDWRLSDRHKGLHRFVKELIAFRLRRLNPEGDDDLSLNELLAKAQVKWHGVRLDNPDWAEYSHSLAFTAVNSAKNLLTHVMMHAYTEPLQFEIPPTAANQWRRCIDTFLESPEDILEWDDAPVVQAHKYLVQPHSIVVLFSAGE